MNDQESLARMIRVAAGASDADIRSRNYWNAIDQLSDVDHQSKDGITALQAAGRNPEIVDDLLKRGANPNLADNSGFTPLICAVKHRSEGSVRLLLDAGADPNAQDQNYRNSALWYAVTIPRTGRIPALLTAAGADPDLTNKRSQSPRSVVLARIADADPDGPALPVYEDLLRVLDGHPTE